MLMTTPLERSEAPAYYFKYIDLVPRGDLCALLDAQRASTLKLLGAIPASLSRRRYAPDKWTIADVAAHINDTERVFAFRAFWFARGFDAPAPGFDQMVAAQSAAAHERSWPSHVDEFAVVRAATLALFRNLPASAWQRRGTVEGNSFTVRAVAHIMLGHVLHHTAILNEKYLAQPL
jgi:hypothetical protein